MLSYAKLGFHQLTEYGLTILKLEFAKSAFTSFSLLGRRFVTWLEVDEPETEVERILFDRYYDILHLNLCALQLAEQEGVNRTNLVKRFLDPKMDVVLWDSQHRILREAEKISGITSSITFMNSPAPTDFNIPPQVVRDLLYVSTFVAIGALGLLAKSDLDKRLEERVPDSLQRKLGSYVIIISGGATIGGCIKGIRTGTAEGVQIGLIAGGIAAFLGASLYEIPASKAFSHLSALCQVAIEALTQITSHKKVTDGREEEKKTKEDTQPNRPALVAQPTKVPNSEEKELLPNPLRKDS